jgi:hypothetical protein
MTFEEWFGAQLPRLVRFTTVLCGGPDPAEEVLQDVALKAHRRWDTLRDLDYPEAYSAGPAATYACFGPGRNRGGDRLGHPPAERPDQSHRGAR